MTIYNTNQCIHGSLERKCEICERDNEIKELKAELAAAKGQVERMREAIEDTLILLRLQPVTYTQIAKACDRLTVALAALSPSNRDAKRAEGVLNVAPAGENHPSCGEVHIPKEIRKDDAEAFWNQFPLACCEWLRIEDQMPPEKVNVLLFYGEQRYQTTGRYMGDLKGEPVWTAFDARNITHWMPLPEPPTSEESSAVQERLWCAACGTWGDHRSGSCPTITHKVTLEEAKAQIKDFEDAAISAERNRLMRAQVTGDTIRSKSDAQTPSNALKSQSGVAQKKEEG